MSGAEIAHALGGRRSGVGWIARCPAHADRKPSLSIRQGEGGKPLLKCFAGCSYKAIINALGGPLSWQTLGLPYASLGAALGDAKRSEIARRVWLESAPVAGTLAEIYVHSRGLTLPVPPTLRFRRLLRHPTGVYAPALIAAVECLKSGNAVVAIHRTWLQPDGSGKAALDPPKAALGPIRGGAVRLAPPGETLCLCEGVETALSVHQATGIPAWAALGTANLGLVELPEITREVIIAADADEAGERAAQQAAQRFLRGGRRVLVARPDREGSDFNDYLTK